MPGGKGKIRPEDGKQFSSDYQPEEKWTEERALEVGKNLLTWINESDENMFFEEFLMIKNDYYPQLISYLCEKFTTFSKLIARAKKIQEIKLYKFGVGDQLNASMTKFVLINEHNKIGDNNKLDVTSNDEPIGIDVKFVRREKKPD